ncbi:hypothetical protein N7L95_05140 [Eleftheria terrae]|nr:hypothetical protein N7L95_05140 [Eleftheria terrae]
MQRFLRAHGRPALATVISARETGGWSGNSPALALVMSVEQDGQPVRELRAEKVVPVLGAALFQPGAKMRLLVHPTDPQEFLFDEPWNAADEQ